MLAPFIVSATDGRFDCPLHGAQNLAADVTDCCAKSIDGVRGGKIVDGLKTVFVKIAIRFKSAPFQKCVGDADCGGRLELHFQPGTIIVHQERTVNDGADVLAVVIPIICDQLSGNVGKLLADPFVTDAVCGSQRIGNRLFQIIVVLPQVGGTGIAAHTGVRHIENVVQTRISTGFIQQGDAFGTSAHITVHPVIPDVVVGAGRGIGPLGVDHQLILKAVLVQPGCRGQVRCPAFPIPGQTIGRALGKGKVFFGFAWHFGLLFRF
ncbi:hypothetical protein FP2_21600 [Faecalibacterium prausnitzii L2-6]|uniref:Uncharacterized protein n=2 Tax=Faecalibacterium prausnitzii TaxID=853 RepID=D4JZT3_9FIRM|nr:hypothetical protein FP2_21600 [Faecalibacterium prausnitzii L2-6]